MTYKFFTDNVRKCIHMGILNFKASNMDDHQAPRDHQTALIAPALEKDMNISEKDAQF